MKPIPFLDLGGINHRQRQALADAALRVIDSGWYILGAEVDAFEREFADYCGAAHCAGVATGLDALHLALEAAGVQAGDEVIVPGFTFIATWLAVSRTGAKPVPVEPEATGFNLDPAAVEAAITPRTRAIIAVHLYGIPADMTALRAVADRHGLFLLEDAAQAHGARWRDQPAGSLGDAAAFSFYPGKNLGALGDGGAVTCRAESLDARVRLLRNYGSTVKYVHEVAGYNARLDEMQAAFLRVKLPVLEADNADRRRIAARYTQALAGTGLGLPVVPEAALPVWHLYVVRHPDRDGFAARLREAGIQTMIHYPHPCHRQEAYRALNLPAGALPRSEQLHAEVLSLPIWPGMSDEDVTRVIDACRRLA